MLFHHRPHSSVHCHLAPPHQLRYNEHIFHCVVQLVLVAFLAQPVHQLQHALHLVLRHGHVPHQLHHLEIPQDSKSHALYQLTHALATPHQKYRYGLATVLDHKLTANPSPLRRLVAMPAMAIIRIGLQLHRRPEEQAPLEVHSRWLHYAPRAILILLMLD